MKVTTQDLSQLGVAGAAGTHESQKPAGTGSSSGQSSGGSDHVDFSSTLGSLSRAMNSDSSGRQSRVSALAAQYQAGSYAPNSAAISRGLISEAFGG